MQYLSTEEVRALEKKANEIRQSIIEMLTEAGSGHTAGSLDMADIFTLLYFNVLQHDPKNPDWEERDRLVLSAGHICPVLYATMAHAVRSVVLQKIRNVINIPQVINSDNIKIRMTKCHLKERSSNSTKTIDCYFSHAKKT
jgi:transketolase